MKYEDLKNRMFVTLLADGQVIDGVPQENICDLTMIFRFYGDGEKDADPNTCGIVTYEMADEMGVDRDTLFSDAVINSMKIRKPMFASMRAMLGYDEDIDDGEVPMYVMSTADARCGAAALFYPGAIDYASGKLGGDFYAIPSSIHEWILIPVGYGTDENDLRRMVADVNDTQVNAEDRLSYNVYRYYSDRKTLAIA